ncbi:hypothetical protein LSH36_143g05055, partial [Paralvinella palmiformis]
MKAEEKKSEETKKKGDLEIRYMVTDPGYQGAVMRISSVLVIFRKDNQTEELILEDGDGISVNGNYHDLTMTSYKSKHFLVRAKTSVFTEIRGFGFSLFYDPNGRIYISLNPYFTNKIQGLCGNMNGDRKDEFMSRAGIIENVLNFAYSYSMCSYNASKVSDADRCSYVSHY